jgi:hypothetical protein
VRSLGEFDDMPRAEFLAWAKARALEYLPDRPDLAIASIRSDLMKHSGTAASAQEIGVRLMTGWLETESGEDLRLGIEAIE